MRGIYYILREYEQELTKQLIDVDAEAMASWYLSRLQLVVLRAEWEGVYNKFIRIYQQQFRKGEIDANAKAMLSYCLAWREVGAIPAAQKNIVESFVGSVSKLFRSGRDTNIADIVLELRCLEEAFACLKRRASRDRVAHEIVHRIVAKLIDDEKPYYIPESLQSCKKEIAAGQFPRPNSSEGKRVKFLRNIKIVKLLVFLIDHGIAPTHNAATAPGQYGIDIVGKLMKLSPESIATIWQQRDTYYSGHINSWNEYREVSNSEAVDEYRKELVSRGDGSPKKSLSSLRGFRTDPLYMQMEYISLGQEPRIPKFNGFFGR